jgi:type I restriction enzyme M protein
VFKRGADVSKYARMVGRDEIEKNDFNLNLPRYIDSQPPEDRQDIEGHLKGGIPARDVEALRSYWTVCPALKKALFKPNRPGYVELAVQPDAIRATIHENPDFRAFTDGLSQHFAVWGAQTTVKLKALRKGFHPKALIVELSEALLGHYRDRQLINAYDVYQHLMDYWAETMQDDAYLIAEAGWKAEPYRVTETKKGKDGKEKVVDKGWACDLVPKSLIVGRYFAKEAEAIARLEAELDRTTSELVRLEEGHGHDEGLFSELIEDGEIKATMAGVKARLKEIKGDRSAKDEAKALNVWLTLTEREKELKRQIRQAEDALDDKVLAKYPKLSQAEVKTLVVDDKWMVSLKERIGGETARAVQRLSRRIAGLADRYGTTLSVLSEKIQLLERAVADHLAKMGQE